jgi:hypothetical protein
VTKSRTRDVKAGTVLRVRARAIINGRGFVKVASGAWDGYWLRDSGAVDRLW